MFFRLESTVNNFLRREDSNLSSRQTLSSVVIGVTNNVCSNTLGKSETKRLTTFTLKVESNSVVWQALTTVAFGNFVWKHSSKRSIDIFNLVTNDNGGLVFKGALCLFNELVINRDIKSVVLCRQVANSSTRVELRSRSQQWAEVQSTALVMLALSVGLQVLSLSNHIFHFAVTELCHDFANLFCQQEEIIHNMFWLSCELFAQFFVLCCNSNWACV